MSPEEEQRLREEMARIREEATREVDLDDPYQNPSVAHQPAFLQPLYASAVRYGQQLSPTYGDQAKAIGEAANGNRSTEQEAFQKAAHTAGSITGIPVVGGLYTSGSLLAGSARLGGEAAKYTPAMMAAQHGLDYGREVVRERSLDEAQKKAAIIEKDAKAAIENLKRKDIAKKTKDRDEASQRYRVERPEYQKADK